MGAGPVGVVVGNPVADEVRRDGALVRRACGGTATYATLALRALGLDAALVGQVGADHDGMLREPLARAGVDLAGLGTVAQEPSTSYLLDYEGEPPVRRVRLVHRGPVMGRADVPSLPAGTAFVHVGMVAGEVRPDALAVLAAAGRPLGIDLHALRCFDGDGTVRLGTAAESGIDFAAYDTVKGAVEEIRSFDPAARTPEDGLRAVARRGVRHVFATDGGNGARLLADGRLLDVPACPVREVDATGAGDVFLAAFLFARHVRGEPARDAALFAAAAASFVVEGAGTTVLGDAAAVERRRAGLFDRS